MRISDWSSDVCSSDLAAGARSPGDAMKHRLGVLPEVRDALATGRPVVALESTIITHGMPAPRNLETARRVEAAVRAGGAVPATIAVLDGRIRVGLTADDLERSEEHTSELQSLMRIS